MNKDTLKGQWKEVKGKIQSKWGELTNDDLDRIDGDMERLQGSLQKRYGYSKDEAKKAIDNFKFN